MPFSPAMVKFGVPSPEAAWAMSAGVPVRSLAVEMALRFSDEKSNGADYGAFRDWIAKLDSEVLRAEYDVESPVLEEVTRAINGTSRNQLLRDFRGIDAILPLEVPIRGTSYSRQRTILARQITSGTSLRLKREYDNVVDRNAVIVIAEGGELGYLPREVAQVLAVEIDAGLTLQARASVPAERRHRSINVILERAATP